ncbi:TonB-dependent siderophore receptor [Billgrantia endophytica]|uniref:TonB-dependent siderophore receptor n=1 Tax=Billgrantia endophytica TaxID=2033802 RepID=A0A2N7TXC6_9GAMM|nr:TonB-dependent siderophore receptor [Halomonas endophytica]PMR72832.1 TonB-dependent siderophore receptor [Halomonas endophytica]
MPSIASPYALSTLSVAIALAFSPPLAAQTSGSEEEESTTSLDTLYVTAEAIARQALGSSTITAEDIERRPPANDLSDLIRTMPGVNLTGNSASGQYGNNRQIDLRGMGPENTLILIDGKPVGSRDSIRMGRSGERNTRGDTNWVPVEAVERIEVLRGPAAARYGSGASGGVINIITKRPTDEFSGSLSLYGKMPEHGEEGSSQRAGFTLSGPLADSLSFRLYGNVNKTDADSLDLNADHATGSTPPAGREGVRNRDVNALLRWDVDADHVLEFEAGTSRQGNIYAGDRAVSGTGSDLLTELANAGEETNRMYRNTAAITHRGTWGDNASRLSLAFEGTNNSRLNEGLAGGAEGSIDTTDEWSTSRLRNYSLDGEVNVPTTLGGVEHVWTLGFEHRESRLEDPYSVMGAINWGGAIPGVDTESQDGKADATLSAAFVENNIYLGERWTLTPGLRFDHHSQFGHHLSPSLNAQFMVSDTVIVKGGVARAFKAPNLYQSNPNYLYYTMGNGCPYGYTGNQGGGCYILGNADLDPETSLNKEIGIEWADRGYHASLTYFHNDYKNRIQAGLDEVGRTAADNGGVFQWENAPKAVVSGFEGNLRVPLLGDRGRTLSWDNNLTYMIENENQETGQPLSIIPRYTLNTSLDWRPTDDLSLLFTGTLYGKQEPPTQTILGGPQSGEALNERDPYSVWGLSAHYYLTDNVTLGAGIDNLFDKRLFREDNSGGAGASTYNEPGRAYFLSMNVGF